MASRKTRTRSLYVAFDGIVDPSATWEAALRLVRRRPVMILPVLLWAIRGRQVLARRVADQLEVDGSVLPYRPEVLLHLEEQRRLGRRVVLVPGQDPRLASAAAAHLGLFHHVLEAGHGDGESHATCLERIREDTKGRSFDFLSNGSADPEILRAAECVTVAGSATREPELLPTDVAVDRVLARPRDRAASVIRLLRIHQWSKNLLIFVPAVLGQVVGEGAVLARILLAFAAFSLTASGIYVLNDLLDLDADRRSETKRRRPFASGQLPVTWGIALAPLLVLAGLALSFWALGTTFGLIILVYVIVTTAYSIELKHRMLIDVIILAGLYTLRLLAGGAAAGVEVSSWLLAFSMFLFLSLAFAKRYNELQTTEDAGGGTHLARPYEAADATAFQVVGPTCGLLSILVLALYINSETVAGLYSQPRLLWFLCPVLLYWIVRVWFLTMRGRLHEDPVVFALTDRASYVAVGAALLLLFLATRSM